MLRVTSDMLDAFLQTSRLMIEECLRRDVAVKVPYLGSSFLHIQKPDGTWSRSFSSAVAGMDYTAAKLVDNKFATHAVLSDAGLPVLPTQRIALTDDVDEVYENLSLAQPLVVKPLNGSHGDGITVNVRTRTEFRDAIAVAKDAGSGDPVIIQEQYHDPIDIRILCVENKFVSAVLRLPARVQGNGVHTVSELMELENKKPDRGERYVARLGMIDIAKATEYLGDAVREIPANGEWKSVLGMANYGAGGETEVITAHIPEWLKQVAEQASAVIDLPLCGVDFLIQQVPSADSTQADLHPIITEINKAPSLYIHEHPTNNQGDKVIAPVIDYLLSRP